MSKVVFAGDSNTAAQYVTTGETFASLVGSALGYDQIVNAGGSGNTSAALLARFAADVVAQAPLAAFILIGTNDMSHAVNNGTPNVTMLTTYVANISDMIDLCTAADIKPVVISPPLPREPRGAARWPRVLTALRDLCHAKGAFYVPLNEAMLYDFENASGANYLAWYYPTPGVGDGTDTIHLGVTGHARAAAVILRHAVPVLSPDTATGTCMDTPLTAAAGNGTGGTAKVELIRTALTVPPHAVTKMRFTLKAHADEPLVVSQIYLGQKATSGDAWDAASLVPVEVGNSASFTIPQGASVVTDWCQFPWDRTANLIVSMFFNGGASADRLAGELTTSVANMHWKSGADEAVSANASGYTSFSGRLCVVTKVEADGF